MIQEKIVYQGKIIEVVEQAVQVGDKLRTFEKARRSPGTRTLVHATSTSRYLLTKEFRHETQGYDYRLPGGKVFDRLEDYNQFLATTDNSIEGILIEAKRGAMQELREEVGLCIESDQLKHLYTSVCGATVEWDLYYFICAVANENLAAQELEEGEDISVGWYTTEEVRELALSPQTMSEDRSAAVLLRSLQSD